MKPTSYLLVLMLAIAGCGKPAVVVVNTQKAGATADPWLTAKETFRQTENTRAGDEWTRYRGGCEQLKSHFVKPDVVKKMRDLLAQQRAFLEKDVQLTADELLEVESTSFISSDAHYLDECYLLADAAKALDVSGLSAPEQAKLYFRWVMRNVLPHEQTDSWLPPAFTLRRGYGGTLDRALVFLALLRQAQIDGASIDGCVLMAPEPEPKQFLVAVLDRKTSELHLFDPRLGLALPGKDGKGILTLKQAVDSPDLLKLSSIVPGQLPQLEPWLACPLNALAPRMQELQNGLAVRGETVTLYLDGPELAKDISKAAKRPAKVWNAPLKDKTLPNSPTRSLRLFLPKQEGGIDTTNRLLRFADPRVLTQSVAANFAQLNLTEGLLPPHVLHVLHSLTNDLVNKYDLQAREMYLRGQFDWVVSRHDRLKLFAKNDALAGLSGDQKFIKEAEEFRQNALKADAAGRGPEFMNLMLAQEFFIRALVETSKEEKIDRRVEMKVVTRILAVGIRDHFAAELARMQAAMNHERADHAQARVAAEDQPPAALKNDARDGWIIAKNSWENSYLENFPLQSTLKQKLKQLEQVRRERIGSNVAEEAANFHKQLTLLEIMHLDAHKYFHARQRLAECLDAVDGAKAADAFRRATLSQIDALEKEGLLAKELNRLKSDRRSKLSPLFEPRLELLARDWAEQGNYYWLKQQIERTSSKEPLKK